MTALPMPDPGMNVLERNLWFCDRLREAGIAFEPGANTETLSTLYRGAYAPGEEPGTVDLAEPVDSWRPLNLGELPERPPTRPTLGGVGLVYPGMRHVFSGAPESAKTIAAYVVALYVVRSGKGVVLIDFEMGKYDARSRLRELGASSYDLDRVSYVEPDEPATADRIALLTTLEPALVVIDAAAGAYDVQGLDDNKRADVEKLARLYVSPFWHKGIATIFIDHVVKNSETRGHYAIGSERKLGGADVHLGFETISAISRGTSGRYKITTHKDRGGYLKRGHLLDLVLESDPGTHQIGAEFVAAIEGGSGPDEVAYFRPTRLMEKVSIFLELQAEAVSKKTVEDGVTGKRDYVRDAISVLVREGFAVETDGPRGAKMVARVTAYRESDDVEETSPDDLAPPLPDLARERTNDLALIPPLLGGGFPGRSVVEKSSVDLAPIQSSWLDDLEYLDKLADDEASAEE